jgi:hypothetical protein
VVCGKAGGEGGGFQPTVEEAVMNDEVVDGGGDAVGETCRPGADYAEIGTKEVEVISHTVAGQIEVAGQNDW